MTRDSGKETVSLSVSNWLGLVSLVATVGIAIGSAILALQGRMTTVEVKTDNMQRQIDSSDARSTAARNEIMDELKAIRQEQKAK